MPWPQRTVTANYTTGAPVDFAPHRKPGSPQIGRSGRHVRQTDSFPSQSVTASFCETTNHIQLATIEVGVYKVGTWNPP